MATRETQGSGGDDVVDLVVEAATSVVTMAGQDLDGGWVACRDGVVVAIGDGRTRPPAARDRIDASGCLVTPGFVNTHHHMYQNLTRNWASGALEGGLVPWLQELYPVWSHLDEEAVYVSTWIALAELALGGCTTTTDHLNVHPHPFLVDVQIRAARDFGARFHATRGAMDRSEKDGALPTDSTVQGCDDILADCERLVATYHDPDPLGMVKVAIAPCNPFATSSELMQGAAELADRLDVRLHTHLAESPDEEGFCLSSFGMRPLERLESHGYLTDRTWVAHGIFIDDDDVSKLGAGRVGVAHCPTSNVLFNRALTPVRELRAAGSPVGLGTDGGASAGHGSLYNEARLAALVGDLRPGLPRFTGRDALAMATVEGSACLGSEATGRLEVGAAADLVVWPLDPLFFTGATGDLVTAWLRDGPVRARDTVVAGRPVVRDGALVHPELEELVTRHQTISRRWRELAN